MSNQPDLERLKAEMDAARKAAQVAREAAWAADAERPGREADAAWEAVWVANAAWEAVWVAAWEAARAAEEAAEIDND